MDKIAKYEEIERRGLLDRLPADKQAMWAEYKRRKSVSSPMSMTDAQRSQANELAAQIRPNTPSTFGDRFAENVADMAYGARKALSGATLGASDWALRKLGAPDVSEYEEMKRYNASTDLPLKASGFVAEAGGNMAGAGGALLKGLGNLGLKGTKLLAGTGGLEGAIYGATGSDTLADASKNSLIGGVAGTVTGAALPQLLKPLEYVAAPVVNRVMRTMGLSNLKKQLSRGDNFKDVELGRLRDKTVNELNSLRQADMASPFENSRLSVPADSVQHIYEQRILNGNYTPKDITTTLDSALFKGNNVERGSWPTLQSIYDNSHPANKAIVGKHRDTGGVFVKTTFKDKSLNKNIRGLDGRPAPSYTAELLGSRVPNNPRSSVERLSDIQAPNVNKTTKDLSFGGEVPTYGWRQVPRLTPDTGNVTHNFANVKPKINRSFVEVLADRDKARILRNGVLAGADDISENARILEDMMARRKEGWYNADFEKLIKTPELARAEKAYGDFIEKNGRETLSAEKVSNFYNQHPVAQGIIEEMREVDPRAFDGILPGSLAEFDMLKKILREEAGNKVKVGASKAGAIKRAENDLKNLMDSEFKGFKDVNRQYADAATTQDIFESKLKKGLTSVGGGTANTSPFWSGFSAPLTAAGFVGSFINPASLAWTAAGLGGKALLRNSRRNAARRLASGVVKTGRQINPVFANGLNAAALNNLMKYERSY